jgi:hypothetical protein
LYIKTTIKQLKDDADATIEWNRQSINVYVENTIIGLQKDADDHIIAIKLEINITTQARID